MLVGLHACIIAAPSRVPFVMGPPVGSRDDLRTLFIVFVWLGGLHVVIGAAVVAVLYVPDPVAVSVLCGLALAAWLPVERPFSKWQVKLAAYIACVANEYFPVTLCVHEETRKVCDAKGAKVVMGLEPHSVLPISVIAFHDGMKQLPRELDKPNRAALASSAIFRVPLVKHLWSWLGLQSVDKRNMRRLLDEDNSVLLIPGGVQECLLMERGKVCVPKIHLDMCQGLSLTRGGCPTGNNFPTQAHGVRQDGNRVGGTPGAGVCIWPIGDVRIMMCFVLDLCFAY